MKTFTSISLILCCFSISTYATEYKFVAADNTNETKACIAAVTNNTKMMKSKLRKLSQSGTGISFRTLVNTIKCNDQYIGNFAKSFNAETTFAYLDRYTNKRNKKQQSNVTIKDIASEQKTNKNKKILVLVGGD